MENSIEKNSDKKIKKRGNQKGKKYTKALERRREGLILANQISEEREKYRNSFINYKANGFHEFKMYIPRVVEVNYKNGKYHSYVEKEEEITYMTYSTHKHDFLEDNSRTEDYKINFSKIWNEIDRCVRVPFKKKKSMEHYILNCVIRKLGFITTPHALSDFLKIDLGTIIDDILDGFIPYYQLGQKIFIPTSKILNFIKLRKVNYVEIYI